MTCHNGVVEALQERVWEWWERGAEPLPNRLGFPDVAERSLEAGVAGSLHDAQRLIPSKCHPGDPRRAKVVEGDGLLRLLQAQILERPFTGNGTLGFVVHAPVAGALEPFSGVRLEHVAIDSVDAKPKAFAPLK